MDLKQVKKRLGINQKIFSIDSNSNLNLINESNEYSDLIFQNLVDSIIKDQSVDNFIRLNNELIMFEFEKNTNNYSVICPYWQFSDKTCKCSYICGAYVPSKWNKQCKITQFKRCESNNIEHVCSGYLIEVNISLRLKYDRLLSDNKHKT